MKKIAIIGGGAASFLAAEILSDTHQVTIYEKGSTIGRKFLVAGKGGFNLSHHLSYPAIAENYTPNHFLDRSLKDFTVQDLRSWYTGLGISTYVGSSSRIFPEKGISPADVLRAIKKRLAQKEVNIKLKHEFVGFDNQQVPIVRNTAGTQQILADKYIFALGGASWGVTGSTGNWLPFFSQLGIKTLPFQASNSGLNIHWPEPISAHHIGKPLKNISVTHQDLTIKGEALITQYGIEGNAIYPISSKVRASINQGIKPEIIFDLKPQLSLEQITEKCKNVKASNVSKVLKLNTTQTALLKAYTSKIEYLNTDILIHKIKKLHIPVLGLRPTEEAISTVGGIAISELSLDFSLQKHPSIYCIGEMVNWDAPTGGFLLQGCFSMAHFCAKSIINQE